MNVIKIIIGLLLFCNVAAVGLELLRIEADYILYVNLLGCSLFGAFIGKIVAA